MSDTTRAAAAAEPGEWRAFDECWRRVSGTDDLLLEDAARALWDGGKAFARAAAPAPPATDDVEAALSRLEAQVAGWRERNGSVRHLWGAVPADDLETVLALVRRATDAGGG